MIKIIRGAYGFKKGNSVIPKTVKDEPFSCDEKEEKRLVALGVAQYVTKAEAEAEVEEVVEETKTETEEKAEAEAEVATLDKEALIARFKELGLGGNPTTWKAETIARKIAEAEAKLETEEAPELNTDDGVVE